MGTRVTTSQSPNDNIINYASGAFENFAFKNDFFYIPSESSYYTNLEKYAGVKLTAKNAWTGVTKSSNKLLPLTS